MNERIMAFVRLLVPLIVYIATAAGIALDTETVYCVLLIVAGFGATIWCWWKNNNVTSAAQTAQLYLDALKAGFVAEADLVAAMPDEHVEEFQGNPDQGTEPEVE